MWAVVRFSVFWAFLKCYVLLWQLETNNDWEGVHREQIKASTTLKKLKRSLEDLESVKSRLDPSQQPDFEQLLIPLRENARKSIEDFAGEMSLSYLYLKGHVNLEIVMSMLMIRVISGYFCTLSHLFH